MRIDNSPARGTRDLLPAAVAERETVLTAIARVYEHFGYQRIETPALEDLARLTGGHGGENEKLIFKILKRGLPAQVDTGTYTADLADLGLRFDLTVPLARYYGQNHAKLPMPFRSLQVGPVWRAERPQKGRYRQFYQCDIDIIGEPSVLAEIELIEATTRALGAIGLEGSNVRLSDRRLLSAIASAVDLRQQAWPILFIALDKLDKIGWEGVRRELVEDHDLPSATIDAALTLVRELAAVPPDRLVDGIADAVPRLSENVLKDLEATTAGLTQVQGMKWVFDPTLVRGMGYYTGQIFEVVHPDFPSSLAGGGRYDELIGPALGRDMPACGFSVGLERICDLVHGSVSQETVAVVYDQDIPLAHVLATARRLRDDGQRASTIPRSGKLGAQIDRLQEWGFTSLVLLGSGDDPTLLPQPRLLARRRNG